MFLSQYLEKFSSKLKSSKAQDLALQILSPMKWKPTSCSQQLRSIFMRGVTQ
ncbi:hypothetical protein MKW94_012052, partial [Papaver nudicaule]|nr:hypothetical protein [Papaver nudicaule]